MSFSEEAIRKAEAVVRTFETGKPVGDAAAVSVLNDEAGISYGISQFTHRSGSLERVVRLYLDEGAAVGRRVLEGRLSLLARRDAESIRELSEDRAFRSALRAAGMTAEMRAVQERVAYDRYLRPADAFCAGRGFVHPLTLAVVYDSMTHGSFDRIRAATDAGFPTNEKEWVTEYVRRRDAWLESVPRLRATRYRTRFFLRQIMLGRWDLELPLIVHGALITNELLRIAPADAAAAPSAPGPEIPPVPTINEPSNSSPTIQPENPSLTSPAPAAPGTLDRAESQIGRAADSFDRVERATRTVVERTDRAKSLWTTVTATLWQTGWAVLSFLSGLPREVWLTVAAITAATMLFYLYRQIALGRLREQAR